MSAGGFVTRFAPSPTGFLHEGHAFSALTGFTAAQAAHGRFMLRIEDIDVARCRPRFEAALLEDLAWLGIRYEEPALRQSEHLGLHLAALNRLRALGLAYRCFRTRREILEESASAPHGPSEGYRGAPLAAAEEARRLAAGEPFAWRLSLEAAIARAGPLGFVEEGEGPAGVRGRLAVDARGAGDVVLGRKGLGVAYHLAVVVDDARQGVTCVIRGRDLFEATHVQRLLQSLLGLPEPAYRHHRLILDEHARRLSKRDGARTLRELRARGVGAAELRARLGFG
ncbi:MAG TPA: tRNA glutamyl-Q(34) synthetase GluQRS [Caulobacteraceae bacterium]|nr:tRNA glutamyl-Q(34) synthetase GluQRS [Caulobacteraceae bacterium]